MTSTTTPTRNTSPTSRGGSARPRAPRAKPTAARRRKTDAAPTVAVVGPGRVGQALARHLREQGCRLLGFHGRTPASCAAAVRFAGGRVLAQARDLAVADVVLLTVSDREVARVASTLAKSAAVGAGSLWVHASGSLGLAVLAPLAAAGARTGSLHPLLPFPSARIGYALLPGSAAGIAASAGSLPRVRALARRAGLVPIDVHAVDRARYHAACALVANGITTLCGMASRWLADVPDGKRLIVSLLRGVTGAVDAVGAANALTGPAARGDVITLRAHLSALRARPAADLRLYAAAMQAAARAAHAGGGLSARELRDVRSALRRWLRD